MSSHEAALEFVQKVDSQGIAASPVLSWPTRHGLDPVWARLEAESLLLATEARRLGSIMEQLQTSPLTVAREDKRQTSKQCLQMFRMESIILREEESIISIRHIYTSIINWDATQCY